MFIPLTKLACEVDNLECIEMAKKLFKKWMKDENTT